MSGPARTTVTQTAMIAALSLFVASSVSAGEIAWQSDMRSAHKQAQKAGKPMLIQLTASWCHYCKKMKATTYADAKVSNFVTANFIPVMLDADKHPETVRKLNLRGLPATVIVAPDLVILNKLNGYQTAHNLTTELNKTLQSRRQTSSVGIAKTTAKSPSTDSSTRTVPAKSVRTVTQTRQVSPAFGGLSLVALREGRELKMGTTEFQVQYGTHLLYFADKKEVADFRRSPEHYWPMHGGQCIVSAAAGQRVAGRPEFGVLYRGSVWMFETADKMRKFVDDPGQFVK